MELYNKTHYFFGQSTTNDCISQRKLRFRIKISKKRRKIILLLKKLENLECLKTWIRIQVHFLLDESSIRIRIQTHQNEMDSKHCFLIIYFVEKLHKLSG